LTTDESAATPEASAANDYVSDRKFADFPISPEVLKAVLDMGYEVATQVQAATIDAALAGKDMVVRAKTGTGKTCAFSLPAIERVPDGVRKPSVLILEPTRELAQQTAAECDKLTKYRDVSSVTLVGGLAIGPQEQKLAAGAEIIVGTPGRVKDHIGRGNLDLSDCLTVILDEADEMLSMGFFEDVTKIMDKCGEAQVLLFSATISPDTERLVARYLEDPEQLIMSTDTDQVENIDHIMYETDLSMHKVRALLYVLDLENPQSAIIFCNTREDTATVATFLDRQGLDVQILSGELPQGRRSEVMAKVKSGEVRFLAATDVASRGIDISELSHVINYALPADAAVYLHRTGRTGRIGKQGRAISLVGGADMSTRKTLETKFDIKFEKKDLPDAETIVQMRVERQAAQIRKAMGTIVFESYLPTVRKLKEMPDGDALLAAALRAFFTWQRERKAAMSDVDSLGALREGRREKREERSGGGGRSSKGRGGGKGRGRGDRDRGGRDRDRGGRDGGRSENLDDMLSSSDAPPAKKKRKRKSKPSGDSDRPLPSGGGVDLDAMLSVD
jgi:ATP-dependent RNA helicase DeaD